MEKLLLSLCLALALVPVSPATAKPGSLDPEFGRDGRVVAPLESDAESPSSNAAIANLAGGGAIVLIDDRLLAFEPDGRPDPTFGGGRVRLADPLPPSTYSDLAVDNEGRVVVGGTAWFGVGSAWTWSGDEDVVLARFDGDGSLDPTFGTSGVVRTDFGSSFQGTGELSWIKAPPISKLGGLLVDSAGRILLSGLGATKVVSCKAGLYLPSGDAYLARLQGNGGFDPTFAQGGRTRLAESAWVDAPILSNSGTTYLLDGPGTACHSSGFQLSAWGENGGPSPGFGQGNGVATGGGRFFHAVATDPKDRVVIVDAKNESSRSWVVRVRRFLPDGSIDLRFGADGAAHVAGPAGFDFLPSSVAVEDSGGIIVAGTSQRIGRNGHGRFIVARFRANGILDQSFGRRGRVVTAFGKRSDAEATALTLVPRGILVAGPISSPDLFRSQGLALVRYSRG
ncbi:MAG TPA: delta-60 repeat domain-containing protein [Acidimicrobiales bacterium]|nr:delta-60 repeat domain-containing protein [Acidimicrobiales bacterium]